MAIVQQGSWSQNPFGAGTGMMHSTLNLGMSDPDVQKQLDNQRLGYATQERIAQMGANAAMLPAELQQQRFNSVFPWLQGQFKGFQSQLARPGGQSPPSPEITVGGILNPQQIQQQVNAMKSSNEQTGATQMNQQSRDLAGRGFGSNSPLLMALHGQTQASTLGQNVGGERDIRLGAAQQNAQQLLNTQQARAQAFAQRQQEDIARRQPYFSMANTLLSSLAGLA